MRTPLPLFLASIIVGCSSHAETSATTSDALAPTRASTPKLREEVIYLVIPDRFRNGSTTNDELGAPDCHAKDDPTRFHGGDLEGLRQHLDYVSEVGASAVWTTPLYRQIGRQPQDRCGYHGYWADFTEDYDPRAALEPKLGTTEDLHHLVEDLHARGMRFILDMVVNHTGDTARLPRERPDWFHDPSTCASLGSSTIFCPLDHHPDFDQERAEVATYLTGVAAWWTREFAIDGIRMDTAKHVTPSYFAESFLPGVAEAARGDLYTIAEVFDDVTMKTARSYLDAGFQSAFHFPLQKALVEVIAKGGSTDRVADAIAEGIASLGWERARDLVLFLDNHDIPRFTNAPGFGVPGVEIQRRLLLALDLVFTLPGVPQIYYGDELGVYGGKDPDNRRDLPAWAMSAEARSVEHPGEAAGVPARTFKRVQELAAMRKRSSALSDGTYRELWRQNGDRNANLFAFARGEGESARVVVLNNGAQAVRTRIPIPAVVFPNGTGLHDELGDAEVPQHVTMTGGELVIDLPARSAAVYRR